MMRVTLLVECCKPSETLLYSGQIALSLDQE